MKTEKYATTDFNAGRLVNEITDHYNNTLLASQAIGILYCDSGLDCSEVVKGLNTALGIPVVGGTVMSFLSEGISAIFTIFHGDDVFFSAAISESVSNKNYKDTLKDLYESCLTSLNSEPKLIIPFIPYDRKNNIDAYAREIFMHAGDVPVFGGVHAHDLIDSVPSVFCNDQYTHDGIALLMMGGNIKPLFSHEAGASPISEYSPLVTLARGNKLYEVDGKPFCQYAQELGIHIAPSGDMHQEYGPLRFEEPGTPPELADLRSITSVAEDESYVTLTSHVPVPSRVSMTLITKEDIIKSATACVDDIKKKIAENERDGYEYTSVLCVSCVSRYLVYIGSENFERELINKKLPTARSYYAFGEIGPVEIDGKLKNRFNNSSLIICAI